MLRYVALLRGVMPTNASMPALRQAFEAAGFSAVKTVLGSGNVVFDAHRAGEGALERQAEAAMLDQLGRSFHTIVRSVDELAALLADDPFARFDAGDGAKRVVTFRREAPAAWPALPIEADDVRILTTRGREVFTTYVPNPRGPVFMTMLEKAFGKDITTRTWDTLVKCSRA
jgi:uncharacterized protein (DUF1697 family)